MNDFNIIEFNYKDPKQLKAIGELHGVVLPGSNVPGLGQLFARYFYYSVLPERDLINCFLAVYKGEIVGLLVGTKKPSTLISRGMKGNLMKIALILGVSVLIKPSRLKSLIEQLKYKVDPLQKEFEEKGTYCEFLTIGVLEAYRSFHFDNGKKIANKLAEYAFDYYKKQGFTHMTGQIIKTNIAPIKFWSKYNGVFFDSTVRDTGKLVVLDLYNVGV